MASMMAVAAMHEEMHQRACEKRQPNQKTENVGAVLGKQQHSGNDRKGGKPQYDPDIP